MNQEAESVDLNDLAASTGTSRPDYYPELVRSPVWLLPAVLTIALLLMHLFRQRKKRGAIQAQATHFDVPSPKEKI